MAENTNISDNIDYLEVDKPIPGQNFVCISFVSPEKIIKDKNLHYVKKFLNSISDTCPGIQKMNLEKEYEEFIYKNEEKLELEYNKNNNDITSTRGIKIRGTYSTKREADIRAQVLQRLDKNFHVYVGQVGYWLPWDPNPDRIADNQYMEKELQNLVKYYNNNQMEKEIFYKDQVRSRKESIVKENLEKKKKNYKKKKKGLEIINSKNIMKIIQKIENNIDKYQNLLKTIGEYKHNKIKKKFFYKVYMFPFIVILFGVFIRFFFI